MPTQKLKVAVLRGGLSEEREISLKSGDYVLTNLPKDKFQVLDVVVNSIEDIIQLRSKNIDIAFLALHGKFGEDGRVQSLLELLGIQYTGASVEASIIGFDKFLFKQILHIANIPVPDDIVIDIKSKTIWQNQTLTNIKYSDASVSRLIPKRLGFPVFVKPNISGSSYGITKVKTSTQLSQAIHTASKFGNKVIVEKAIEGDELTIGFVGKHTLPPVLIRPKKGEFFDYQSKYEDGGAEEICPAPISEAVKQQLNNLVKQITKAIPDFRYGRIDLIYDQKTKTPFVLEINTLPGMTATSLLPKEARAYGWSDSRLLEEIIKVSIKMT